MNVATTVSPHVGRGDEEEADIQPLARSNRAAADVAGDAECRADAHERRAHKDMAVQFQRLKDEARVVFGVVDGRPGVRSPREWAKLLDRADDEIGNGRFIVRCLGAERYLDALTVAALVTLRQGLLDEIDEPSMADVMMVDAAVLAYYNMLRAQRWIGDASLVFEGELFGRPPLNEIHGPAVGNRLREQLERLAEVMLPIQDRCHRMLVRSLAQLPRKGRARTRQAASDSSPD